MCALPVDITAAQEMFRLGDEYCSLNQDPVDNEEDPYTLDSMGGHKTSQRIPARWKCALPVELTAASEMFLFHDEHCEQDPVYNDETPYGLADTPSP